MPHNVIGVFFLLILVFLLLNNGPQTVNVLGALGSQATALTGTLQGRQVTQSGSTSTVAAATQPSAF